VSPFFAISSRIDLDTLFSLHASVSSGLCNLFLNPTLKDSMQCFGSTLSDPDPEFTALWIRMQAMPSHQNFFFDVFFFFFYKFPSSFRAAKSVSMVEKKASNN
jgi:hypothetical protein